MIRQHIGVTRQHNSIAWGDDISGKRPKLEEITRQSQPLLYTIDMECSGMGLSKRGRVQ